nr:hypothetical protein [Tanacetum cinerariifolium]
QTVFFQAKSEIDVLKEDIKPDIKDASIGVQDSSIACEIVYSSCTNNVKIPRLFLESLAPGFKIDEPVIDAWADLLNFNERYKSANSPSRYFFKQILTNHLKIEDFTTHQDRLYTFEKCINLIDYDTKRIMNSDKMFHLISVFDKYLSKNSPERHASIFRNVEPKRMKMIWRTNKNELDSGVFLMSHMDNYFGQSESKWEYGFCKESKEQTKQLKFLTILHSENNSYKDEFQKKVDKVRSIDKNTRRALIEKVVLRRTAKLDEYLGIMKS